MVSYLQTLTKEYMVSYLQTLTKEYMVSYLQTLTKEYMVSYPSRSHTSHFIAATLRILQSPCY